MAGLTPFQFSSGKRQYEVLMGYTADTPFADYIADGLKDVLAWYEMWINPASMKTQKSFKQSQQHTAGSIVTFHYRPEYTIMSCSGRCGWVRIHSILEEARANIVSSLVNPNIAIGDALKKLSSDTADAFADYGQMPWSQKSSHANRFNNSPLAFLKRLQAMAEEPMYYIDNDGVEHYNPKFIKIFTKQHQDGLICEGYFTQFNVQEEVDLGETIGYDFTFVIQKQTPVTLIQRILGAYAGFGSAVGDATSIVSGAF